jgi:DNA-binding MarR family transcriptional regulator
MAKKIKTLEEWWFIFREVDTQDKRVWRFFLSHKSIKIMEDIHPIYEQWIECMFENIPKSELSLTIKTITQILHTLEKMKCKN